MSDKTLPPTKHQCGTCGAVFDTLEALQAHARQHRRENAEGEAPESETRRTGSRTGSNVSPVKEGDPLTSEDAAAPGSGSKPATDEPSVPPDKP